MDIETAEVETTNTTVEIIKDAAIKAAVQAVVGVAVTALAKYLLTKASERVAKAKLNKTIVAED